jgi:hypothetical protein
VVIREREWDNGALRHLHEGYVMYIADIIWLPHILDKLVWKHHVSPEEVEEVLFDTPLYHFFHIQTNAFSTGHFLPSQ